jgi:hypothetical protein
MVYTPIYTHSHTDKTLMFFKSTFDQLRKLVQTVTVYFSFYTKKYAHMKILPLFSFPFPSFSLELSLALTHTAYIGRYIYMCIF